MRLSKDHNINYLAQCVVLNEFTPIEGADRIKTATVQGVEVIVSSTSEKGARCVYFPVESRISSKFLKFSNSYRDPELNLDPECKGYFEHNRRVKAVKMRGTISLGYLAPWEAFQEFCNKELCEDVTFSEGKNFDQIGGEIIIDKYNKPTKGTGTNLGSGKAGSKLIDRIPEGQLTLHPDTANLRRDVNLIVGKRVSVTYKLHGCNATFQNVPVMRDLKWYDKFAKWIGVDVKEFDYKVIPTSRKVVKDPGLTGSDNPGWYGQDVWRSMCRQLELDSKLPKGYSLYGEIVGFTSTGGGIQGQYDYGCEPCEAKFYCFNVTHTTECGTQIALPLLHAKEFCETIGIEFVPIIKEINIRSKAEALKLIESMDAVYEGADCYMCKNKVPAEGVVVRISDSSQFKAFKVKTQSFLLGETKALDSELEK